MDAQTGQAEKRTDKLKKWVLNYLNRYRKIDLRSGLFLLVVAIFFGLAYWFNNVMANFASKRSMKVEEEVGRRLVLPDLGFELLPTTSLLGLTDAFVTLTIVISVLLLLVYERPYRFLGRFLLAWGLSLLLRITTIGTTSLPDPRSTCEYITGNIFTEVALHRCGDLIFSGHTIIYATNFMACFSFSPRNILGKIITLLVFGVAISGSIIVLANRAHYTVDVLLAWYISIGSWYIVAWVWYWQITVKKRFLIIEYPMGLGRHRSSEKDAIVQRRIKRLELDVLLQNEENGEESQESFDKMSPTLKMATAEQELPM
ncbi:Phosphatidylinositol:ceramide inositolphosphotransferase [Zancudomyces culisetae]|uniref:Phosphatidylinositol:ceramide inositolphosphotransferase n=1 Tax=Zancudomyces culisetae TaxID=1213189 RepID=A0A1R1PH22_ZANCU|nr:Phosphatidylinositol:ceramide inositolphosphotransferase [Zancudomyces culisetae]OMH80385.1 Phosphatidylinositol:ceramide inositolphosphotransferase [Zancudomyces culisetae]|eukprot:OMH80237.1 Phosphatidylinositol:ceramide inositolphosphotransferase [Zancudomyces culisetae]